MGIFWGGPPIERENSALTAAGKNASRTPSRRSRRAEILAQLTAADAGTPLTERLCEVSTDLLGVSGASLCVVGGARHEVVVHATDSLAEELADLQLSLGEGPGIQAVRTGTPVLVPDVAEHRPSEWHAYAREALARGVRALFTFPLRAGPVQLGALDLYRREPGPLTARQAADALLLCGITNRAMLAQHGRAHLDASIGALHRLGEETAPGLQHHR